MMQAPPQPPDLPVELWNLILSNLSGPTLARAGAVSKQWRQMAGGHMAQDPSRRLALLAFMLNKVRAAQPPDKGRLARALRRVENNPDYRDAYRRFHQKPAALGQAPPALQKAYREVRKAVTRAQQALGIGRY